MMSDIFVVIVLYKMLPQQSVSLRSLQASLKQVMPGTLRVKILLYDNTPGGQEIGPLEPGVVYEQATHNAGLAGAYNRALELAAAEKFTWLLTLDQDTALPMGFLARISGLAAELTPDSKVAAIVPQIVGDSRMLSPLWFRWGAFPTYLPRGFVGVPEQSMWPFNSASTIRVSAIKQIGGYSSSFWLDNADSYLYLQLRRYDWRVYVAGDLLVEHDFSMLDIKNRMTLARYQNILMYGGAFRDMYMSPLARLEYTARLVVRMVYKHPRHRDPRELRTATRQDLIRRLFHTKESRLERWREDIRARDLLRDGAAHGEAARPRVSVCMATYNGEKYIAAQLKSILSQLDVGDEVIIFDDASSDATRTLIKEIADDRVQLIESPVNRGVQSAFEETIRRSSGEILFLSDQDDLWAPNKVARVLQTFAEHPEVRLVNTDALVIDSDGESLGYTYFEQRGGFKTGIVTNILKGRYHGCTMAFRSTLLPEILPFPRNSYVLHDLWIGMRNRLSGGDALHIDEPLVFYRRHSNNASGPLGTIDQIKKRFYLLKALLTFRSHKRAS